MPEPRINGKILPRSQWKQAGRLCTICEHEQRSRIDYLLVTADGSHGTGKKAIADKYGVQIHTLTKHSRSHITDAYRAAVLAGPFRSEDDLRQLAAEEGTSVLQNYRAVFNGHRDRWLRALEIGDDEAMVKHGRVMDVMLWRMGQLTREIAPHPPAIQQNVFMSADYYTFERRALKVLRRHPEALQDWISEFREVSRPALIEVKPNDS
jgi:hypothetical protein